MNKYVVIKNRAWDTGPSNTKRINEGHSYIESSLSHDELQELLDNELKDLSLTIERYKYLSFPVGDLYISVNMFSLTVFTLDGWIKSHTLIHNTDDKIECP